MFLFGRLPVKELIGLCRALRHNLDAGITLQHIFAQQAKRGTANVRPIADRIALVLQKGYDLEKALADEGRTFPPLFIALTVVGEQTGTLPEVFKALEAYYSLQQRLWRRFVSECTLPIIQFFAAIFVVTLFIFILGIIAEMHNTEALDPFGVGAGPAGALRFLALTFGTLAGLAGSYFVATRFLKQRAAVDGLFLRLPAIGPCLFALCMSRFCVALHVTLETAMPIDEALDLSLRATGNAAFASCSEQVQDTLRGGDDVTTAIAETHLFTEEFQTVIATAEESGRLPEVMKHQAKYYEDEAEQKLTVLTKLSSFGVWAVVAIIIIIGIFRIAMIYLNAINQAMPS